jgi:tRNA-2-methylthio-N6-dimethylallyladenosine synthase
LPKLAEHVHLPLQSGSNRILKAMHRPYTAEKYVELVGKIRAARPGVGITTDVIVGFPGETDADYKATRSLVAEVQFDNAFVFRYSPRRETPAAEMPDQIDEPIKQARNHDLLEVVNAAARRAHEKLVGTRAEILCEGPSKTNAARLMGRTRGNKVVVFDGERERSGKIFDVAIERANGFSLYGTPVR